MKTLERTGKSGRGPGGRLDRVGRQPKREYPFEVDGSPESENNPGRIAISPADKHLEDGGGS